MRAFFIGLQFLTRINIFFFDGIVGLGISIWIFITGIKIFKESYDVLMDKCIDNNTKEKDHVHVSYQHAYLCRIRR